MAAVVVINDGHGLRVEAHRRSQPNNSNISGCISHSFHFNIPFKQLYKSKKMERFSYKVGCSMCGHTCIEVFKRRAGLGYR